MMKLSPAAELAVRGVIELAARYGQGPITLDTICSRRKLSRQYLTKMFNMLARVGVVTTFRGKRGGYALAKKPSQITLLEVIEAVEGPVVLNICQQTPPQCNQTACVIRPVWAELQKTIRQKLGKIRISDCLNGR